MSYDWLQSSLKTIHKAGWYRTTRTITSAVGNCIEVEGKQYINFSSNDYLGLANDSRLKNAAIAAIQRHGTGTTGSRLVTGHRALHDQLEQSIAALKGTEAALVFSSGYSANIGTIAALVGKRDLILNDHGFQTSGFQTPTVIEHVNLFLLGLKNGHKAHWALLSGLAVVVSKSNLR